MRPTADDVDSSYNENQDKSHYFNVDLSHSAAWTRPTVTRPWIRPKTTLGFVRVRESGNKSRICTTMVIGTRRRPPMVLITIGLAQELGKVPLLKCFGFVLLARKFG